MKLICPGCKCLAYASYSVETMQAILRDLSEPIGSCGVGPWGYVCATKNAGHIAPGVGCSQVEWEAARAARCSSYDETTRG